MLSTQAKPPQRSRRRRPTSRPKGVEKFVHLHMAPTPTATGAAQGTRAQPRPPRPAQTPPTDAPRAVAPLAVGGGLGLRAGALGLARARPLARQHARKLLLADAWVSLRGRLPVPRRVRLLACACPGSGRSGVQHRIG